MRTCTPTWVARSSCTSSVQLRLIVWSDTSPTGGGSGVVISGVERLAGAAHVIGAEDQTDSAEGRVGEVDVHVGVGEPAGDPTERPARVRDVDNEPLPLVSPRKARSRERIDQRLPPVVGDEHVYDA